jgi:hypothetical protein
MTSLGRALPLLLVLAACANDRYNQGNDIPVDDSGTGETDDGGDDGADGGTTDDGTGGDDGGTDDGGDDGGTTQSGPCRNIYDPVDTDGWTKEFAATYNQAEGTSTMEGRPGLSASESDATYQYFDAITTGADGWTGTVTVNCQDGTADEGMHVVGWDMDVTYSSIPMTIQGTDSVPRLYLPADWMIGGVGSWDYSYTLAAVTDPTKKSSTLDFTVTGTYTESGFQEIELFDGSTVSAYKLTNTYAMTSVILSMSGVIEQWWVPGLGLVKEINTDSATSATIMTRDLTGYTGLEVLDLE